jgi:hypothetical protein
MRKFEAHLGKQGSSSSVKFLRQYIFLFRPSTFQVKEDRLKLGNSEILLAV